MRFGEVEVATSVPGNLDARLRASMGVSALEVLRILTSGYVVPGVMARFVEPLVEGNTPPRGELVALIVKAGANAVRVDLAEIYRAACGVEAPASPPASSPAIEPPVEELTVAEYCRRIVAGEIEDPARMREIRAGFDDEEVEAEFRRLNEEAATARAAKEAEEAAAPGAKKKGRAKRGK